MQRSNSHPAPARPCPVIYSSLTPPDPPLVSDQQLVAIRVPLPPTQLHTQPKPALNCQARGIGWHKGATRESIWDGSY